jgi:hypothetical protein
LSKNLVSSSESSFAVSQLLNDGFTAVYLNCRF